MLLRFISVNIQGQTLNITSHHIHLKWIESSCPNVTLNEVKGLEILRYAQNDKSDRLSLGLPIEVEIPLEVLTARLCRF